MSSAASWSYTAKATIWRSLGNDSYGDPLGYTEPAFIWCDYQGGLSKNVAGVSAAIGNLGTEVVIKNTIWTEFAQAKAGDYVLIGESTLADPIAAGADEVVRVIRYADTFERALEDFAIITG